MKISELFTRGGLKSFFHSELFRYGVAGVSVTLVNFGVYTLLFAIGVEYTAANIAALVLSKTWGYFANKFYAFKSHTEGIGETLRELLRFVAARGFTGLVDYFAVIFLVELLGMNELVSKYAVVALIIILNYILGKKLVFKKSKGEAA